MNHIDLLIFCSLLAHSALILLIKLFLEAGDSRYRYQNELDKACLQHDMTYEDPKDLAVETASILIKTFMIKYLILPRIQRERMSHT